MDLRWLDAPNSEVAAAMAQVRKDSRPSWVPTKRQVLVHVNHCLMLWYLCLVWMTLGVRIDTIQDNRIEPRDVRDIIVLSVIFVIWVCAAVWLHRWAARPPSRRARMADWRQTLTALANGFEPQPTKSARFDSLITVEGGSYLHPRFATRELEFGNLGRRAARSARWTYLTLTLDVPLPHLLLDSTTTKAVEGNLPVHVGGHQRLSLEGDFDRWFRLYVPAGYERDALFFLTPDLMALLIDHAAEYSIEVRGSTVIFFAPGAADFSDVKSWSSVGELLTEVAPALAARAARYRDDRVPSQGDSHRLEALWAPRSSPGATLVEPRPQIGPAGERLAIRDRRRGGWAIAGAIGWFSTLAFLYAVPGIFAFAGFMSIIDGR